MRSRRSLLIAVGLVVTAVFTYYAVRNVHPDEVWEAFRASNKWWLLPSLAVLALGVFVRAIRWWALFAPETRPPLRPVVNALLVGLLFNSVLPLRVGEAARIVALNRAAASSRAETLGTVALERALDVLCLLLLLFIAVPWLPELGWLNAAIVLAAVVAGVLVAGVIALALYGERPFVAVARGLGRLPLVPGEAIERAASNVAHGLAGLRRWRLALGGLLWTSFSWVLVSISFWLVTLAFGLDVPPVAGLLVLAATGLAMILPAAPASLGVFEAATLVALAAYGVSESEALSYALVLHALNFFPYLVAGAVALRFTR